MADEAAAGLAAPRHAGWSGRLTAKRALSSADAIDGRGRGLTRAAWERS